MIDCDVHHGTLDIVAALRPHLSRSYQEQLEENGLVTGIGPFAQDGGVRGWRPDLVGEPPAQQPAGGAVAWDVDLARRQLFDERDFQLVVLTGGPAYGVVAMPDLDYGSAICRAFNAWTLENWMTADSRFRFAISVNSQDPDGAAEEIARVGTDPGVCAVLLPTASAKPLGHRMFEPIYVAAERHRLPIVLHAGADGTGSLGAITSAGTPSHFIEAQMAQTSFYQVHLSSLIFEGVLEHHPELKVVLLGAGLAWLPAYLWRMDADWKALRYHTPWVRRLPSEQTAAQVRFGTQPLELPPGGDALRLTLDWIRGERTVLFASHYPRWDSDDPTTIRDRLPAPLAEPIFDMNPRETFRL